MRPACSRLVLANSQILLANPRYLTEIHRSRHELEKLVSVPEPSLLLAVLISTLMLPVAVLLENVVNFS